MDNQQEDFMILAIEEAKAGMANGDLPFGAVVVCESKVVGSGHAENNTTGDVTDHAELLAVRDACKNLGTNDLSNCVIYCSNEPCLMCAAGIFQANIPKVIIGVSRADVPHFLRPRKLSIEDLIKDSSYEIEIIRGVMKDEILPFFDRLKK
jgi:tRNA(Arg) A34 adenosine deaminase TadA